MTALGMCPVGRGDVIRFNYTNYQMETEWRTATVMEFWYGASTYHQGEQWFCQARDHDRQEMRNFALRDMREVRVVGRSGP